MIVHIIPSLIYIVFRIIGQLDSSPIELIRFVGLIASIACYILDVEVYQYQLCQIIYHLFNKKK